VNALVVHPNKSALYVYAATIPSSFLDKLERPSEFSLSPPINISYHGLVYLDPENVVQYLPTLLGMSGEEQAEVSDAGITLEQTQQEAVSDGLGSETLPFSLPFRSSLSAVQEEQEDE
jgi:hypothetical protein